MRILAISHEADRTGAPISLYSLMDGFVREDGHEGVVALRRDGPLQSDFAAICETHVLKADDRYTLKDASRTAVEYDAVLAFKCLRNPDRPYCFTAGDRASIGTLRSQLGGAPPDLVYVNTSHCGDIVTALGLKSVPHVVHVRELGQTIDALDKRRKADINQYADFIICVSKLVEAEFLDRYPAFLGRTAVEPPAVIPPVEETGDDAAHSALRALAPTERLVIGVGTLSWRKGVDLFINAADRALESWDRTEQLTFAWIGGGQEEMRERLQAMIDAKGRRDRIVLVGEVDRVWPFYRRTDALLCTSREDPYPRVMIEAGMCGAPIVAFEGAGGADDYVSDFRSGQTVASGDADAMARALLAQIADAHGPDEALAHRVRSARSVEASRARLNDIFLNVVRDFRAKASIG